LLLTAPNITIMALQITAHHATTVALLLANQAITYRLMQIAVSAT
jgi:hypothetical protein